jgi:hypothetical protein
MIKLIEYKFNNKDYFNHNIKCNNNTYIHSNINNLPSIKEWYNGTYTYNKNASKLFISTNKYASKLIREYFNLYSLELEKNIKLPKLSNWIRRLSIKRILIGTIEFKHTNDKLTITLFIYNRHKIYILNKINKLIKNELFVKKINLIKEKIHNIFYNTYINSNNMFKWDINNISGKYENIYFKSIIKRFLLKIKLYIYYRQMLLLNEYKFRDTYITSLKILLEKIYKKKIEFNIISLKYYNLNSDIHLQVLAMKLRNRNNRIYKVLNKSFLNIKLPSLSELILYTNSTKKKVSSLYINNLLKKEEFNHYNDILDNVLSNYYNTYLHKNNESIVLNSIKHKIIGGIRIEATGRLSKRLVAARTIFKYKYTGSLRNLNSSFFGMSSTILRGNVKSNLDYKKFKSKTKIGSFGLKSWINSV